MGRKHIDLTGKRCGLWTVLSRTKNGWLCRCDCGTQKNVRHYFNIKSGRSRSCGCQRGSKGPRVTYKGNRYGSWTVLGDGGIRVLCKCDCGTTGIRDVQNLRNGKSLSCGCKTKGFYIDLTGKKFHKLTVTGYSHTNDASFWKCVCDCGTEKIVRGKLLTRNITKHCGCVPRKLTYDLTGKQIGHWTVLQQAPGRRNGDILWDCKCSCGRAKQVCSRSLRQGTSKSCGCRGTKSISS